MGGSLLWCLGLGLIVLLWPTALSAQPARIIILRHAEKLNRHELCDLGKQRAEALAAQFLGQGATQSLFKDGQKPEAFLAITEHTIETITPTARSWNLPVIPYTVSGKKHDEDAKEADLIRSTQEAAHDVLNDPRYAGKTVVMTWEHKHIANSKLENASKDKVTLRQLLHLDQLADVHKTWPDSNYDYFWIVDYAPDNPLPTAFQPVRQTFTAPFDQLPANKWGEPEPEHTDAGCKK